MAALGFVGPMATAARIGPARLTAALSRLGVASIAHYVMHVIIGSGLRITLLKVGLSSVGLHLLVETIAGVALPTVAFYALRQVGMLRWFGLGGVATRGASREVGREA